MKKIDRDRWLDTAVMIKGLSDKDVAAFIQIYTLLDASSAYEHRPKQLPAPDVPEKEIGQQ